VIRRACVALVAWMFLVSLPSAAVANNAAGARVMRFAFWAHGGYRVHVFATQSTIVLRVDAREGAGASDASTSYLARALLNGERLRADFGDLGGVSMRFVPSSGSPWTNCVGTRLFSTQQGKFVGSLRFRGENDYLGVELRRAKGAMATPIAGPSCHPSQALSQRRRRSKPKHKLTSLYTSFRKGLGATYFQAYRTGGRSFYTVTDESGGEQVAVSHYAFVEASPLTFVTDSALSFASVSPPYPFSGTGLIQRNANGSRVWSGSLAVSFPGDPGVSLTGPEFKTDLLREW
jgi:hypothetical protein